MADELQLRSLSPLFLTAEAFSPYGQAIWATADGKPFGREDAKLILDRGVPRFYIMHLQRRSFRFHEITRHCQCTQCLGSLDGKEWFLAVAPPGEKSHPEPEEITVFRIPGSCFVKLDLGTWHAGPYFEGDSVDFYNLELSNTNIGDRETVDMRSRFNVEYAIALS
ncbi:ureidoglycolate lyase [Synechococcus sp. PCC 7336]|uniref:ureidoglycolate lyase n=1 Tax=Synechococcus sp. PCC 7336 TaxID=195250 RepID=UPI00034A6AAA|nr:ureidoglycolate lyase [Synechococcus sp. PCC 7336]